MRSSIRPLLLAAGAGSLLLAACSSDSQTASNDLVVTAEASASTEFNDADVVFAQSMIPHHNQAVEMAEIALTSEAGASAEIQALATQIQGAQDPEVAQMTSMLEGWGQPMDMEGMDGMEEMEGMASMDGMMSAEDMAVLTSVNGPEFDVAWATAMIAHHEGAVGMAQIVKAAGSNPEVLALAEAIIAGQQIEIDQMKAMIGG